VILSVAGQPFLLTARGDGRSKGPLRNKRSSLSAARANRIDGRDIAGRRTLILTPAGARRDRRAAARSQSALAKMARRNWARRRVSATQLMPIPASRSRARSAGRCRAPTARLSWLGSAETDSRRARAAGLEPKQALRAKQTALDF
jgi:hypothetical protein